MPYIAIKAFPRDEEAKRKMCNELNEAFVKLWGLPQEAINISIEEVAPEEWDEKIVHGEIDAADDKMYIRDGIKRY